MPEKTRMTTHDVLPAYETLISELRAIANEFQSGKIGYVNRMRQIAEMPSSEARETAIAAEYSRLMTRGVDGLERALGVQSH